MKTTLILDGLNCPNCAAKIEDKIKRDSRFSEVEFNFINKHLSLSHELKEHELIHEIDKIVSGIEDGVEVLAEGDEHSRGHSHEHEHEHKHEHEHEHGHSHGHSHSHGSEHENRLFTALRAAAVIGLLLIYFLVFKHPVVIILAYIAAGGDVIVRAVKNIGRGQVFDENFLMSIATIGALVLGEYTEALAVMIFYQIGEFFQDLAVYRSQRSISELMGLQTDTVDLVRDSEIVSVSPSEVNVGDTVLVKSGAKIPVDGTVIEGCTSVDTSALTGESIPRELNVGDKALSGCINKGMAVKLTAESLYSDSTAAKIARMAENAAAHKAKAENFISAFAKVYTPAVVMLAVLLAVLPCIALGFDTKWIYRGLIFLVASCPCALVLSVPLCFFSGIGKASRQGVLIKGSSYIQTLSKIKMIAFDKTGTLTTGSFTVEETDERILALAASLEQYSTHPIAAAIVSAFRGEFMQITDVEEISGFGITGKHDGKAAAAGSRALMEKLGIELKDTEGDVYVAENGVLLGTIRVTDTIKPESSTTMLALEAAGIKTAMLTGDKKETALKVCRSLGISNVQYELLPDKKLEAVKNLRKKHGKTAFVGDGINDAPVLAGADVGIAMGAIGSDAAIEAADMVIMGDSPMAVLRAVETSRRTMGILKQNIIFILAVKLIILLLTAVGLSNMWLAVFADVGTALISVLNSTRILK